MSEITTDLAELAATLPTPVLADAIVRLGLEVHQAPHGIAGPPGTSVAGRALPVRHAGSVDVFLEALGLAAPGDVMVVDNEGRRDEACLGDLVALEAMHAGVAGIVVWGLHRDAAEITALDLPVFSYGTLPSGPLAPRAPAGNRLVRARFGEAVVTRDDVVAADANGVVFLPAEHLDRLVAVACEIRDTEAEQVARLRAGTSLREQLDFAAYLRRRDGDPAYTLRRHLREHGRAVEE